jgi:hypothetical protein
MFVMSSVEIPRRFGLTPSSHSSLFFTSAASVLLSWKPLTRLPAPIASWKSSSR